MKLLSLSKKKSSSKDDKEKGMQSSASTVETSDPAAAPLGGFPDTRLSKVEKKKLKEAEKEAKAEAKAAKKEAQKESKKGRRSKRHSTCGVVNPVEAPLDMDELLKDIDPNKVMKVLKKFAQEDSTDLVGVECVKAMKRAEHGKSPRKSKSPTNGRASRRTRGGKPPTMEVTGNQFHRAQTESAIPRRSKPTKQSTESRVE